MSELVMVEQRTNGLDTSSVWIREGDSRLEGQDSDARLAELRIGLRRHFGVRCVDAAADDAAVERTVAALHGPEHMAALDAVGNESTVLPQLAPPGLEPDIPVNAALVAAAREAVRTALSAADRLLAGDRYAYAVCRPPGHHAGPAGYGGSCYLNNAALAAQALRQAGAGRVAVVDIDAHHGNGTQAIFYARPDVYYGSVHVDPGAGWFPHYMGFADERGSGPGSGANRNLPVAPGTGDDRWLAAVQQLCQDVRQHGAEAIVLSLGTDAAAADPESPLQVTAAGYRAAGELIGRLGPVTAVQEGGYHLPSLGEYVLATLAGVQAGQAAAGR